MKRALLVVTAFLVLMGTWPARAQTQNRAGVVVQFSTGSTLSRCVQVSEESITGYELIRRARIPIVVEFGSVGAAVCKIHNEGCSFPSQSCFCQCETLGAGCTYWGYSQLKDNAWTVSGLGAGNRQVRNGDVDGWRWGKGDGDSGEVPVSVTFDSVCGATTIAPAQSQATTTPTQPAPTQVVPTATVVQPTEVVTSAATSRPTEAPSATLLPTAKTVTATPQPTAPVVEPVVQDAGAPNLLPYAAFGAIALGLVVMLLLTRRRT